MRGAITIGVAMAFVAVFTGDRAFADDPATAVSDPASNVPKTLELHLTPTLRLTEPSSSGSALSDADAFNPLRLSLLSGGIQIGNAIDPDCKNHAEMSGNTLDYFQMKRSIFLRLTPQLTLHGFSQTGCAGDSGAGGGFTFVSAIAHNMWLVISGGAYSTPAVGNIPARVASDVRADIVMKKSANRTLFIGVGAGGRNQGHGQSTIGGFHFGGSF